MLKNVLIRTNAQYWGGQSNHSYDSYEWIPK